MQCRPVICESYKVGLLSYGPFPGVGTRRVGRGVSWCASLYYISELCLSNVLDVCGCVSSESIVLIVCLYVSNVVYE